MFDFNLDIPKIPSSTGNDLLDSLLGLRKKRSKDPILALNGATIPLKNCRISPSLEIKEKDTSGQTSATSSAEQGVKGQELAISGMIPFNDPTTLSTLVSLARDVDENNKRLVYVIGCDIARSLKIRQVRFAGRINATEQQSLRAWQISFTLREVLSPSERVEKQEITAEPATDEVSTPLGLLHVKPLVDGSTLIDTLNQNIEDALK